MPRRHPTELLDLAVATAHRGGDAPGRRACARALATVETKSTATDMVSEMDHASEALIRDAAARRPARRRLPRRGDRRDPRHQRRAVGGRPPRRHHQLPLRPPGLERVDRRRGRRTAPSSASSSIPPLGDTFTAVAGPGRVPQRRADRLLDARRRWPRPVRHRLRLRPRPPRRARPRCSPRCCRRCATSGGWARPPSTSARSPAGGSTPTGSGAWGRGTSPPAALIAAEAGAVVDSGDGRRRSASCWPRRPGIFDALRVLLVGFRRGVGLIVT